MMTLPLPLITGLILGFLFLRTLVQQGRPSWTAVFLGAVALQGGVVALALHYEMEAARIAQPISAMAIPALGWMAWKGDALGHTPRARDILHLAGPGMALGLVASGSLMLELLVPLAYLGYAGALVSALWRTGPDLPRARLQGLRPDLIWMGVAGALALSAISDSVIALAVMNGQARFIPQIVDVSTAGLLLGLGVLAMVLAHATVAEPKDSASSPVANEDDHALFARLEALMKDRQSWRDPDLSLAQLARRLSVPAKRLSVAVNLVTGENISRYVNGHRVRSACARLRGGASVTEAMLEAGFLTKSNFNREFRRVTGKTPTDWRDTV